MLCIQSTSKYTFIVKEFTRDYIKYVVIAINFDIITFVRYNKNQKLTCVSTKYIQNQKDDIIICYTMKNWCLTIIEN